MCKKVRNFIQEKVMIEKKRNHKELNKKDCYDK